MIRETLKAYNSEIKQPKAKLFTPYSKRLCMDNAAMIGLVAGFKFKQQKFVENIENLERQPRWEAGV